MWTLFNRDDAKQILICDNCNSLLDPKIIDLKQNRQEHFVKRRIYRFPKLLMLDVKRSNYDSVGHYNSKNNLPVDYYQNFQFPKESFSDNINSNHEIYKLISTIHHLGNDSINGHYINHSLCGKKKKWVRFNDEKQAFIPKNELISNDTKRSVC